MSGPHALIWDNSEGSSQGMVGLVEISVSEALSTLVHTGDEPRWNIEKDIILAGEVYENGNYY